MILSINDRLFINVDTLKFIEITRNKKKKTKEKYPWHIHLSGEDWYWISDTNDDFRNVLVDKLRKEGGAV